MSSATQLEPATGQSGESQVPIPPAEADGFGQDGFSVGSFLNEAKGIETPNVTYETGGPESQSSPDEVQRTPPANPEPEPQPSPSQTGSPINQPIHQKISRVLDNLADDEKPLFQQMSNAAYAKIYPEWLKRAEIVKERDQLKKDLEAASNKHFYEIDGAWELHPEVKEVRENIGSLDTEAAFWKEQYAKAEAGEEWYDLAVNAKGQLVYGEKHEASPIAKAEILSKLQEVGQLKGQLQTKLGNLSSTFQTRYKSMDTGLRNLDKEVFGSLDMTKPHIDKAYKAHLEQFPPELRGNVMAQMLAKSRVVIEGLVTILRQHEIAANGKASVRRVVTSQGPGANGGAGSSGNPGDASALNAAFGKITRDF